MSALALLPVHPLADLIPEMSADEYGELLDSLRAYGYQPHNPVVTFDGQVLDGRHRQKACAELGIEPRFEEYAGESPEEFVLLANVHRRHLTTTQRAMIVLEILPAYRARAKERQAEGLRRGDRLAPAESRSGRSSGTGDAPTPRSTGDEARDEAASKFGISGRTVASLDRVRREAPDLFEQVKAGEKSIDAANGEVAKRIAAGEAKPAPKPAIETDRQRQLAEAAKQRVERAVGTCNGLARGLKELKVAHAVQVASIEEITGWDEAIQDAMAALKDLRKRIKESM